MPNVLSIFSGGGGIDCGFKKAGFDICFSTDFWKPACDTLEKNKVGKLVVCDDIRKINYDKYLADIGMKKSDIDVLVGGPPCPAYSKSRFYRTDKKRALEDENSFTLYEYFRALNEIRPKVFFFENVFGFVYKPHQAAFNLLKERANEYGYDITYKVVNTANYGVPQMRERFICVGIKRGEGEPFVFPEETHYDPEKVPEDKRGDKKPWVTCGNVIGDLDYDLPEDAEMQAGSKHKDLLKLVPPGDNYLYFTAERGYPNPIFNWRSRYWSFLLKLSPERPSWTIQASFSNNMGPFHWKNRFLRINEIKRIQTFDDDYELCGDFREQWRQVGNAVPVKMANIVADAIMEQYFKEEEAMADFKMPYGAEFSPEKIKIKELLKLTKKYEGNSANNLVKEIAKKYFNNNQAMGGNCKNSMVAYDILESGGGVSLSSFGNELILIKKEAEIYDAMAKRILTYLNGMMFIEAIRTISEGGKRPTLVNITEMLNMMGCETLPKTNKHVATMKKWLEKAKVLNGWDIKEKKLESIVGIENKEINVLKGLNHAQICFVRALCNSDNGNYQSATKIRELAKSSFNVSFEEKSFAANIIRPLEEKGLIERKTSAGTHGGNAAEIRLIGTVKADVLAPVLQQIEVVAGKEVIKYIQKPLDVLRVEMDDVDTHVKGLALEAFAIRMMRIVDLDFVGTRVKGSETGGAEVDVVFDTTRLNYSRWQVQCKNTSKVSLDHVAKEVGLSHVLKTNVIVILTTGKASHTAKEYATKVMKELNLCIIFIEKDDINEVLASPANIVDVLNRESMKTKKIKVLDMTETDM